MVLRNILKERIPDKMSREELLAARIRQLEWRSEDMERLMARTKEAHTRNIGWSTKRTSSTPTEEDRGRGLCAGLENEHLSMRKFAKRLFRP